jgi:(R,R)-butanediol dehydrogenase / meso-butanediol dehydrogenase / diacetyl reductase
MQGVLFRNGHLELGEVPDPPSPGPGQVLIDVLACGICETDLAVYQNTDEFIEGATESGVGTYDFDPDEGIVMGHEYAGRVIEVGPSVATVAVGDIVSGYATIVDDDGVTRVAGYSNRYPGGFGERMLVHEESLERSPAGVSPEVATLAEPMSIGEKAVQRSEIDPSAAALVLGAGPIGLGAIAALCERQITPIIAVEASVVRRSLATQAGATTVLALNDSELASRVLAQSEGRSRVIAFECTGESGMIDKLIYALPRGAKIMVVGAHVRDDVIRPWVAVYKAIVINFQHGDTTNAYPITLSRIASGKIDAESLITARVGLDGVAQAFRDLQGWNEHVRIIVMPHGSGTGEAAGSLLAEITPQNVGGDQHDV